MSIGGDDRARVTHAFTATLNCALERSAGETLTVVVAPSPGGPRNRVEDDGERAFEPARRRFGRAAPIEATARDRVTPEVHRPLRPPLAAVFAAPIEAQAFTGTRTVVRRFEVRGGFHPLRGPSPPLRPGGPSRGAADPRSDGPRGLSFIVRRALVD